MTSNLQDLPSHLAGLRNVKYHYWTVLRLLSTPTRCDKGDDMGGVVSDVVGGIGDLGQGVIDTVSDVGASLDDEVLNTDLGKAALLAGGAYLAAPYVLGTGAATGTGLTAGSTGLGLTGAGTTAAGGLGAGIGTSLGIGAGEAALGSTLGAGLGGSTVGGLGLGAGTAALGGIGAGLGTSAAAGGLGAAAGGSLLGGMTTAGLGTALGAAALGSKVLGGGTPSSSTSTTSIDPDVKAAYLRNLEEARATAGDLGQRQFAPFPEYNLGMVQKYMNPYQQEVIDYSLADIERARQGQISAEGARATAAGAFGGTRQGVTRALVDEAALRNVGNLSAQLRQAGFAQAQNLGLSQEELRRQYEQQRLDAARNLGLERLNVAQGALSLQPANLGGSTTTPIYKNQTASALGGALGGASLGSLFGGTSGAQYGALAGGLLGFL
jgi:hypothetical protein